MHSHLVNVCSVNKKLTGVISLKYEHIISFIGAPLYNADASGEDNVVNVGKLNITHIDPGSWLNCKAKSLNSVWT